MTPGVRRVRMDLSRNGFMDVSLTDDASPETLAALRALGEAALTRMLTTQGGSMSSTRAKFVCNNVTIYNGGSKQAVLQAVTDNGDPENKAFWAATPAGQITITVSNPDAATVFEPGKSYYVDFTEAS